MATLRKLIRFVDTWAFPIWMANLVVSAALAAWWHLWGAVGLFSLLAAVSFKLRRIVSPMVQRWEAKHAVEERSTYSARVPRTSDWPADGF
ncbi:MAG: hypothetical protein K8T25_07095 [Planctomycetia bacterium]|nr:hypothetical protein [Planctomycetia bacterium]